MATPREIDNETDWQRIEREAHAQAMAETDACRATPLTFGAHIAWALHRFGLTDALSPVHRVGYPLGEVPYTSCGEAIPDPIAWLPMTPRLAQSMSPCRFCEAEYARELARAAA